MAWLAIYALCRGAGGVIFFSMPRFVPASLALLLGLALAGCGGSAKPDSATVLASNDYDELLGWVPQDAVPYLSREQAHSGHYSAHVGPDMEYAGGYNNSLDKLSQVRLNKLRLRAWVFLANKDSKGNLVTEISDPTTGKQQFYEAIDVASAASGHYNQWTELDRTLTLPNTITAKSIIKAYLWRGPGSQPVYLDDFSLEKAE